MKRLVPTLCIATGLLLSACGTETETAAFDASNPASEAALLRDVARAGGWHVRDLDIDSRHQDDPSNVFIKAPDGTRKLRLSFAALVLGEGSSLDIVDRWGNVLQTLQGSDTRQSQTFYDDQVTLRLSETENSHFVLGRLHYRGCFPTPASESPRYAQTRDCASLERAIRAYARREVQREFGQMYHGYYRREAMDDIAMPTVEASADGVDAPTHSETNVQVAGIDEADVVKTDGHRTYLLSGNRLMVYKTWPAAESALLASVDIEGFAREFFLADGKAIVLSGVPGDKRSTPVPYAREFWPYWWNDQAYTKVTVFDVEAELPHETHAWLLAGRYNTARRIDNSLRLVLARRLVWPSYETWPQDAEWGTEDFEDALTQLEREAMRVVDEHRLEDWLPRSYRIVDGVKTPLENDCRDFIFPEHGSARELVATITLHWNAPDSSVHQAALMGRSQIVYQSHDNLYVTAPRDSTCPADGFEGAFTYVHQFDLSDTNRATYRASGGFWGRINDSFSLDEYRGDLRVATTHTFWPENDWNERETDIRVRVLRPDGRQLKTIGQVQLDAPQETIQSARFLGDRAFVVTFRQVDPLFTLDMGNARQPRVLGELKIPGFSTYLHPLDENHLFAIGNDFDEDGRTRNGVALSIFDVSDMRAPKLAHKAVLGSGAAYSEALHNHRALTLYRQADDDALYIALPLSDWQHEGGDGLAYWQRFSSTLRVFALTPHNLRDLGALDHSDFYARQHGDTLPAWGWWYHPTIKRGVFVEDSAYALSDAGLSVAPLDNLEDVAAEIVAPLPPIQPIYW